MGGEQENVLDGKSEISRSQETKGRGLFPLGVALGEFITPIGKRGRRAVGLMQGEHGLKGGVTSRESCVSS